MRLLLDEMYAGSIAEQLCRCGHDAAAVVARPGLRGRDDPDIFAVAQAERRTLATENIDDFSRVANEFDRRGQPHHGLVLVHARKYPRVRPSTIGRLVAALDALLAEHPHDDPTSLRCWL